jgi:hypothetical protein
MRFFLFVLANAMLFIRPSELIPELGDFELYRYVIFVCLLVSLPVVLQQLFARAPGVPPVAGCVLALFPAVLLSHLSHGKADEAFEQGITFFKIVVYFLLLLGLVGTIERLRQLLYWLCLFSAILTIVAVLRYHAHVAGPPQPAPPKQTEEKAEGKNVGLHGVSVTDKVRDPDSGDLVDVNRMCGTGIFNDPNDLALVLITAIPLCLFWLTDPKRKAFRPLWLALILLFGYALMLTHSRGGLLALMTGMAVLTYLKFGGMKTAALGMMCLPMVLVVFAGRMTEISASEGTGQSRIQLWSDGFMFFQQAPLFGIGMDAYPTVSFHVAHNSYIHCFVELGVVGGTLFLGAFYFALHGLYRLQTKPPTETKPSGEYNARTVATERTDADPELQRLHPYLMAMLVAYAVGIGFLSRSYIVPTYLLLGVAVVYLRLRAPATATAWCKLAIARLGAVSVCFLIVSYAFVRLFVSWR